MLAEKIENPAVRLSADKFIFFRQSGWMVLATVAAGAFMFGVHFFSKKIPESEYGILGTLLSMINCMAIPALGLQMVFAQQAAAALNEEERRQLSGTMRAILCATFIVWLAMAIVVLVFHHNLAVRWQLSNPAALWVTLMFGLGSLWSPIFSGVLQGQQNFLWLGWSSILSGIGRLAAVAVIVLVFGGYATGIMSGAVLGLAISLAVCIWQTRAVWQGPGARFAWRGWLRRVLPLTFGFASFQFLYSADPLFVQAYFDKEQTGFYMAAGTLARALVVFTGPLAAVMFPKIVRSVAHAEKTDVLLLTLLSTALLAGMAAVGLSVIAPWLLKFVFKSSFLAAVPLLPWFAWSMVPLALANVLVNNLLARERFYAVPWLALVAAAYGLTLTLFHDSFLTVIKILGLFNMTFLAVTAFFTWRERVQPAA